MTDPAPVPLSYADASLANFGNCQPRRWPGDDAGILDCRLIDDGDRLTLATNGLLSPRSLLLYLFMIAWCGLILLIFSTHRGGMSSGQWVKAGLFIAIPVVGLGWRMFRERRRNAVPWIVVDRAAQMIRLPRPKRDLPFITVVRLQMVSFGPVGFSHRSLQYRGAPESGELQIIFSETGREQTWCVVHCRVSRALRQFAKRVQETSGIPVVQAYSNWRSEWVVKPF